MKTFLDLLGFGFMPRIVFDSSGDSSSDSDDGGDKKGVENVRPKPKPKTVAETITSAVDIAKGDVAYGLGITKEKPYGYDERTKASIAASKSPAAIAMQKEIDKPATRPAPKPAPKPEPVAEEPAATAISGDLPGAGVPGAATLMTKPAPKPAPEPEPLKGPRPVGGATEAEAVKAGKRGRKGTITTGPMGLLTDPDEIRPKRSLMGLIR